MSSIWDKLREAVPEERFLRRGLAVRRPGRGEVLRLLPLEPAIGWYPTHYLDDRTRPCLQEECFCADRDPPFPVRYDGWIVAVDYDSKRVVLAHLTPNAWKTCEDLRDRSLVLRGTRLTLTRKGTEANGSVSARIERGFIPSSRLPVNGICHRDALLHVWFNGRDEYEEVRKYADKYGQWAPVQGAESQQPKGGPQ